MPGESVPSVLESVSKFVGIILTGVGIGSAGVGFLKLVYEFKERKTRRFQERLGQIVRDLASKGDVHKASGAVTILGMCNNRFCKF